MKSSGVIPESHFYFDPKNLLFLTFGNELLVVVVLSATMK